MTNKSKDIIITIIIPLFIITLLFINIFKKDTLISVTERRALATKPDLTIASIFDGTYMKAFDKYTTDQFYLRDKFRLLKADIDLTIQKNYHNLYLKDDYIIEQIYPLNISSINSLSRKITNIKNVYLDSTNNIYLSIIPDKNYFINENNLKLDYNILKDTFINNLNYATYIDIFPELSLDNYYKTDQHWREETLINVANKITNTMNGTVYNDYKTKTLTTFLGTYAGRIPRKNNTIDDLTILTNNIIDNAIVYNYQTKTYTNIYDLSKLSTSNDKYDVYLSGSVPLITITNNKSTSTKELIIFRDSYTSSLAPLLLSIYSKITLIDTRYISPKILSNYVEFKDKDILFIYSTLLINNSVSIK